MWLSRCVSLVEAEAARKGRRKNSTASDAPVRLRIASFRTTTAAVAQWYFPPAEARNQTAEIARGREPHAMRFFEDDGNRKRYFDEIDIQFHRKSHQKSY